MEPSEDNPPMFQEEVETINNETNVLRQLYEAALKGSVATLSTLIRNDPLILHKISLTSFNETPLHVSALAGHLEFTEALLSAKAELSIRLDSQNRSPLHLASAEGHTEIVKALLRVNLDVCFVADHEERIPLHLAVIRGQVEVMQELINAQPDSIFMKLNGESVLHLAVKYNQLKALKQLVTQEKVDDLLELTDPGGNTILHSAVMLKQSKAVRYLVTEPKLKAKIKALNKMSFNALDLIEHCPRDFKSLEIEDILIKAGGRRSTCEAPTQSSELASVPVSESQLKAVQSGHRLKEKIMSACRKCMKYMQYQGNWVEEMQGTLMLVAALTATISFEVGLNPPGGLLERDYINTGYINCNQSDTECIPGTALMAYFFPTDYLIFIICAIVCFIASVVVILLTISGLPLKNKLCTWLMTIAMIVAITTLLLTFIKGVALVTPDDIFPSTAEALIATWYIWDVLVGIVALFATIHLLIWLVSLSGKLTHCIRTKVKHHPTRNQGPIC